MKVILNTDGNTKGSNPGIGAIGMVIRDQDENVILEGGAVIGHVTNNECEFSALIMGLYNCAELGATEVLVRMDSKLVVHQMDGSYRVKKAELVPYWEEAQAQAAKFEKIAYRHVPREQNARADDLARQAWEREGVK